MSGSMTLTERTRKECEARGWIAPPSCVVERRIGPKTRDFLGFIDMIVIVPAPEAWLRSTVYAIQVTSASNHSARIKKALESEQLEHWLSCGASFAVWSWRKKGKVWLVREQEISPPYMPVHGWTVSPAVTREAQKPRESKAG